MTEGSQKGWWLQHSWGWVCQWKQRELCELQKECRDRPPQLPTPPPARFSYWALTFPARMKTNWKCLLITDLKKQTPENPDTGDFPTKGAQLITLLKGSQPLSPHPWMGAPINHPHSNLFFKSLHCKLAEQLQEQYKKLPQSLHLDSQLTTVSLLLFHPSSAAITSFTFK